MINDILGKSNSGVTIDNLVIDDMVYDDMNDILNAMNIHIATVGNDIASKVILNLSDLLIDRAEIHFKESIFLNLTDYHEIGSLIDGLNVNKGTSFGNISASVI